MGGCDNSSSLEQQYFLNSSKLGCFDINVVERHGSDMPSKLASSCTVVGVTLWLRLDIQLDRDK
jgi:hypothetical protein